MECAPWPPWTAGLILLLVGGVIVGSWVPLADEVFSYHKKLQENGASLWNEMIAEGPFIGGFLFTLRIALGSALVSGLAGTLLALVLAFVSNSFSWGLLAGRSSGGVARKNQRWLALLLAVPLFIPHVVAAQMMVLFLGQSGLLNRILYQLTLFGGGAERFALSSPESFAQSSLAEMPQYLFDPWGLGVILGLSYKEIPFVATLVLPVAFGILQGYGPMARNLGVSWWRFLTKALLPTIGPTAAVASFMCLAYGLVSYEIPVMLGRTLPKVASAQALEWYQTPVEKGRPLAFCLGGILVFAGGFFCLWFLKSYDRYRYILSAYRHSLGATDFFWEKEGLRWPLIRCSLGIFLLFFLLPLWPLVAWSFATRWPWPHLKPLGVGVFAWKSAFESDPSFFEAAWGSLLVATASTVGAVILGIPLAHRMAQQSSRLAGRILELIPLTPLFIPGFMTAMGLSRVFLPWQNTPFMPLSTIICHVIAFSPYFTFSLASWILIQGNLEEQAAFTLGASPWRVYLKISLPKILPALGRGSVFVFIASFGDVLLTMMTQGYVLPTLPMTLMPLLAGGERSLGAVAGFLTFAVPLVFCGLIYGGLKALSFLIWRVKRKN